MTLVVVVLGSDAAAQQDFGGFCVKHSSAAFQVATGLKLGCEPAEGSELGSSAAIQGNTPGLSNRGANLQADTAHYQFIDTNYANFKWWPSFIGGDLFLSGDIYWLHLRDIGSMTTGVGVGAEVRVWRVLAGAVIGFGGNEGIPYVPEPQAIFFSFHSYYGGVVLGDYRAEIGEIYGNDPGYTDYRSAFIGVSRKFSDVFFFEPGLKVMFPIVADYHIEPGFGQSVPVTRHYQLRDIFIALSVRVGIGFN